MKNLKKSILIALILLILPIKAVALENLDLLHVVYTSGDVAFKKEDIEEWAFVTLNMPLESGDRLWVYSGSKAELRSKDGSYIRIDEDSSFDVLSLARGIYQFNVDSGDIYVNFSGKFNTIFQIETPVGTIKSYGKAKFRVEVFHSGETEVSVYEGELSVSSDRSRIILDAREKLDISQEGFMEKVAISDYDDWERWNFQRDNIFEEPSKSVKYLPDELHSYARDFDYNGRWIYERDYGYVWLPTVILIKEWAPYRHGRWVWIKGDYVWVSYEPWGGTLSLW